VAGETVGTADFANYKATVLNFVAPDCPYCFKQVPLVEQIRAEYEPQGIRFVNISLTMIKHFTAREASDIFARFGSRVELARDETESIGDLFKVSGYPTLSILDSSGRVKHVTIGAASDLMTSLRGQLDALILGIPSPEEMLADAEKLHRQTLENNRRTLGEGHRDTLQSMENLAITFSGQDKHDEAEELYREIWNVRSQFLGENDPRTLESMHQLAVVLQRRKKPAEAEALHRQNLSIRQRVLGEDHPETRLSMAHLGMALQSQGKTDGIEPYIAELIELRRRAAQEQDASATTLNKYAWLLLNCEPVELRDPASALDVAKTAAKLSGRHDANLLETLAIAEKMTGDLEAAIETQREALALILPGNFLDRVSLEQTLAGFYKEAGDVGAMEEWYRDSLAQTRTAMPARSLAVGFSLGTLGRFLLEQERYSDAEPVFREVLEIAQVALPDDHWLLSDSKSSLGQSLIGQERFKEAERLVVNAYLRMKDDKFVPVENLSWALERVIILYTAWEKPDEAARFRAMIQPDDAVTIPGV
jgi:tetratricopeptide (TPR) repeat protein